MAGVSFDLSFDDVGITAMLDRVEAGLADDGVLLRQIGEYGVDTTRRRFLSETAPDGTRWAGLSPAYASFKPAGYNILTLSGALMNSQNFQTGAREVRWGSPMIYAAVHQFGATIEPKNAKALAFRLGLDAHLVLARSVTIPARPYLGLSLEDREEIVALTEDYLRGLIGGA